VLGSRSVYLVGCFVFGFFVLACGLARTSLELILFRGFQGIAVALCLPTTISILTETFPNGRTRNTGFSCVGAANPLGNALGLLLGGLFRGFYRLEMWMVFSFCDVFRSPCREHMGPTPDSSSYGTVMEKACDRGRLDWSNIGKRVLRHAVIRFSVSRCEARFALKLGLTTTCAGLSREVLPI